LNRKYILEKTQSKQIFIFQNVTKNETKKKLSSSANNTYNSSHQNETLNREYILKKTQSKQIFIFQNSLLFNAMEKETKHADEQHLQHQPSKRR